MKKMWTSEQHMATLCTEGDITKTEQVHKYHVTQNITKCNHEVI